MNDFFNNVKKKKFFFTCFPYAAICRTSEVTGSEQETRTTNPTVLFPGAGPTHRDPLLWGHGQVTAPTTVC